MSIYETQFHWNANILMTFYVYTMSLRKLRGACIVPEQAYKCAVRHPLPSAESATLCRSAVDSAKTATEPRRGWTDFSRNT
jgi:hypothetical protein